MKEGTKNLFTDETWICLHPRGNAQNTRYRAEKRSEAPALKRPKKRLQVMVAAGDCSGGVTQLHIVLNGQNVDGQYYRDHILPVDFEAMDNTDPSQSKRK